jgi:hypothetical protein
MSLKTEAYCFRHRLDMGLGSNSRLRSIIAYRCYTAVTVASRGRLARHAIRSGLLMPAALGIVGVANE